MCRRISVWESWQMDVENESFGSFSCGVHMHVHAHRHTKEILSHSSDQFKAAGASL